MSDIEILVGILRRISYLDFRDQRSKGGSQYLIIDGSDCDITDDEMTVLRKYLG